MNIPPASQDFNALVVAHARKDFPLLNAKSSVADALACIRREGLGERVIYFFAVDEHERLAGVLPTRRLLTAPPDTPLEELMVRRVVSLPAADFFALSFYFSLAWLVF